MPAGGRRQSVCGGRVVKGSRRCDNLPALTLLQPIWAAGEERGGDMGLGGRVGGGRRLGWGRKGGGRDVGVKGLLSNRCAGARQVRSGGTGQTSAPPALLVPTSLTS